MSKQSASRRACIYLRISLDQTGEGLAVQRQREDCRRIVKERGWELVGEYRDEVSASDKYKKRKGYTELVNAFKDGEFDALVCWDLDRLTRQPRELEDWIDAAEDRGLAVVTANGEADLTTDGGRMYARVKVAVAKAEVERKAARQRRAAKQRSDIGRPPLGVRLTGYTVKGLLVPAEADVIRRVFTMFLSGESLRSISRTLTEEGVKTRKGTPWNPSTVRGILVNPRYAGRAIYQGEQTGGAGDWEALVTSDQFDQVQSMLGDERRITNRQGTDRKHLGAGLFLCGRCGEPCSSWSGQRYRCKQACVTRARPQIDEWVRTVVAERIRTTGRDIAARVKKAETPHAEAFAALNELRARQRRTEADYDADLIDGKRFAAKMDKIDAEMKVIERKVARDTGNVALAQVMAAADPAQAFLDAPLMSQRSIISGLVSVRLHPGTRGCKVFDKASVEVTPI